MLCHRLQTRRKEGSGWNGALVEKEGEDELRFEKNARGKMEQYVSGVYGPQVHREEYG